MKILPHRLPLSEDVPLKPWKTRVFSQNRNTILYPSANTCYFSSWGGGLPITGDSLHDPSKCFSPTRQKPNPQATRFWISENTRSRRAFLPLYTLHFHASFRGQTGLSFFLIWNNYFSCSTTTHTHFVYNPGLPLLPSLQPMAGNWVDDGSGISQWLYVCAPLPSESTQVPIGSISDTFLNCQFFVYDLCCGRGFFYDRCHPFRTSLFPLRPRRHWLWGTITGDGPAVSCHATAQGGRPPFYGWTTLCCKNIGVNECVWSPQTFAIL